MSTVPAQNPSADKIDVGKMIRTDTLASNIISRHNTADAVLDTDELTRLQAFCSDHSRKDSILDGLDMEADKVSLVGYTLTRHGTADPAFTEEELKALSVWFEGNDVLDCL
ncbi:uncharacterized protein KY384_005779 [Bacidia gigantensis]|uniref:uncharacterized protein n=1 Tax=Bacidia gigantensis TaxID=2732470 RepID=UPI001D05BAC4|nr:uncharacterized protein KY384_005779 [Bacidia gigantensis]KAG8529144.1 hypothetical protein KY384_005779 [Bacidia gigantensis]